MASPSPGTCALSDGGGSRSSRSPPPCKLTLLTRRPLAGSDPVCGHVSPRAAGPLAKAPGVGAAQPPHVPLGCFWAPDGVTASRRGLCVFSTPQSKSQRPVPDGSKAQLSNWAFVEESSFWKICRRAGKEPPEAGGGGPGAGGLPEVTRGAESALAGDPPVCWTLHTFEPRSEPGLCASRTEEGSGGQSIAVLVVGTSPGARLSAWTRASGNLRAQTLGC